MRTSNRASGAVIAWQTVYYPPPHGTPDEELRFEHEDASAMSRRMSKADGTVITTSTGLEDSPAEFDATGNSVGLANPYPERWAN